MRLRFPFSSPDSSVSPLPLSFGISLFWGFAQWYFYSALFFQITPPAARSLHPSRCVFLTPEAVVSFDSSPFPLSSYQALYGSDLLQHSSSAFHSPSLYHTHLILQFLPSPTLPLYSFHIAFSGDLLSRNILSFLSHFPSVLLLNHFSFHSPSFSLITHWFLPCLSFHMDFLFLCTFLMACIFLPHAFIAAGLSFLSVTLFISEIFHLLSISTFSFYPSKILMSGKQ